MQQCACRKSSRTLQAHKANVPVVARPRHPLQPVFAQTLTCAGPAGADLCAAGGPRVRVHGDRLPAGPVQPARQRALIFYTIWPPPSAPQCRHRCSSSPARCIGQELFAAAHHQQAAQADAMPAAARLAAVDCSFVPITDGGASHGLQRTGPLESVWHRGKSLTLTLATDSINPILHFACRLWCVA